MSWRIVPVRPDRTPYLLLALLIAALALFGYGYRLGGEHEAQAAAEDALIAQQELLDQWRRAMAIGNELAADLVAERGKSKIVFRTLREEVAHVVDPSPGACGLGPGFVRVWNDALEGRVSAAAGGAAGLAAAADSARAGADAGAAASAAGIDPGRALANHVDNAELCHDLRQQLRRVIEWHHRTGAAGNG